MSTRERLEQALINADKAGDVEAAQALAEAIRSGQYDQEGGFWDGAANVANEFMAGVNRGAVGAIDFLGTPVRYAANAIQQGTFNPHEGFEGAALNPLRYELSKTQASVEGNYMEDGLAKDVIRTGSEMVAPGVLAGGVLRNAAQQLPKVAPGAESVRQGVIRQMGDSTAGQDAAFGALSGAGQVLGGETGEAFGGETGRQIGEMVGALGAPAAAIAGQQGYRTLRGIAQAKPSGEAAEVLDAAKTWDVPVLNTDVNKPKTFTGKLMQSLSEKMGPLGSGTARASQQEARIEAVERLAKEFDAELSSPFAEKMVQSLKSKHAQDMAAASGVRASAVKRLNEFGEVPMDKTRQAIDMQIARQERLGPRGDQTLIKKLNDTKAALEGGNFQLAKDIRTEIIDDVKALSRSEDQRAMASVQAVKKAMDDDLLDFARTNDRRAAADWVKSNRQFAEALGTARDSELKRVLNSGDVTPEKVLPILRGGKQSELNRLKSGLTEDGVKNARAAIIRDMLDESGFFRGDVNPDRLATSMGKSNRMRAINTFFEGRERREIEGLRRLLDSTRRAQQASAAPPTGIQTVPLVSGGIGAGAASVFGTVPTLATAGTLSAIAKTYESAPFRNLLLKIANRPKGSRQERELLDAARSAFLAELQAARKESQQTEETPQQ